VDLEHCRQAVVSNSMEQCYLAELLRTGTLVVKVGRWRREDSGALLEQYYRGKGAASTGGAQIGRGYHWEGVWWSKLATLAMSVEYNTAELQIASRMQWSGTTGNTAAERSILCSVSEQSYRRRNRRWTRLLVAGQEGVGLLLEFGGWTCKVRSNLTLVDV